MIRPDSSGPAENAGPPVDVHCATVGGDAVAADGAGSEGKPGSAALPWFAGISLAAMVASVVQMAAGQPEHGLFLVTLCFGICVIGAWLTGLVVILSRADESGLVSDTLSHVDF